MDYEQYNKLGLEEKKAYMRSLDLDLAELKSAWTYLAERTSEYENNDLEFLWECIMYRLEFDSYLMVLDWLEFKYNLYYLRDFAKKYKLGNRKINRMFNISKIKSIFIGRKDNHMFTAKYLAHECHTSVKSMTKILEGMCWAGYISSVRYDSYREIQNTGYIRRSRKFFKE